jgi:hypothetical protein
MGRVGAQDVGRARGRAPQPPANGADGVEALERPEDARLTSAVEHRGERDRGGGLDEPGASLGEGRVVRAVETLSVPALHAHRQIVIDGAVGPPRHRRRRETGLPEPVEAAIRLVRSITVEELEREQGDERGRERPEGAVAALASHDAPRCPPLRGEDRGRRVLDPPVPRVQADRRCRARERRVRRRPQSDEQLFGRNPPGSSQRACRPTSQPANQRSTDRIPRPGRGAAPVPS